MVSCTKVKHVFKIILGECKRMRSFKEVFVPYFLEVSASLKTPKIIRISRKLCLSFKSKEKFIALKIHTFKCKSIQKFNFLLFK